MRWSSIPRRQHEQILAAAHLRHQQELGQAKALLTEVEAKLQTVSADRERIRGERNQFEKDRDAFKTAGSPAAEDDVRRKALADALGEQHQFYTWEQLLTQVAGLKAAGVEWMAAAGEERTRADGLQKVIDATRARQTKVTDEESRPVDGAPMAPRSLASELLRQKGRADVLAAELAVVTAANQACTCGGEPE
jgi:chromosome segregation ATPase